MIVLHLVAWLIVAPVVVVVIGLIWLCLGHKLLLSLLGC